jgi:hypothetical protein
MAMTTVDALGTDQFLDMLAAEMLELPDDRYIWDLLGFVKQYEAPKGVATSAVTDKKLLVDKPTHIGEGFSEALRRLTDGTDVGIADPLGLGYDQFGIQVREYAGPYTAGAVNAITPIGITEFTSERSLHDIAGEIGGKLKRDHVRWRNAVYRDFALTSTSVVLGDAAAAEGNIVAAKAISWEFFRRLRKALEDLLVAPLGDTGNYRYVIGTNDESNLFLDADIKEAIKQRPDLAPEFRKGYIGSLLGFDIIVDTTMPTKAVGAGGAVTGYQGVAFGAVPGVGHAEPLPAQARRSEQTDYGRKGLFIWKSHEGFGTLDLSKVCVRTVTT